MRVVQQISFEAKNDAEAIRIASERLGRDAVILSTRPAKAGGFLGLFRKDILVVTAGLLEEDEADQREASRDRLVAFQRLLDSKKKSASPTISERITEDVKDEVSFSSQSLALAKPQEEKGKTKDLEQEVARIYEKLDKVLERLDEKPQHAVIESHPKSVVAESGVEKNKKTNIAVSVPSDLTGSLIEKGLLPDIAQKLQEKFLEEKLPQDQFCLWLKDQVPVAAKVPTKAIGGKKVMFVGPTGVGKTTTIAKIAAIHALWERKNVLLLTSDTYRIAAVEQLRTYAKILGVPIEVIFEIEEIDTVLKKHSKADLILLDTAGRNQKDSERLEEAKRLYEAFKPDALHLVLASNMKDKDMLDVVGRMGSLPLTHMLFTKIDETSSYGGLLNVLLSKKLPASFLTTGQNVPNDIEVADAQKIVDLFLTEEDYSRA